MPADTRALIALLLTDLASDARRRSRASWDSRKAFVAAYWATVAVYAGHVARVLRGNGRKSAERKPFRISHKGYPDLMATDWADASHQYCERRDQLGLGASMFPEAMIQIAGMPVGRISYNGRIWMPGPWQPGDEPLFDNRRAETD
ncbi:hypothetical protein GS397_06615 [Sphingobium yanoikuyae]|nr:hypothetical protein FIL70_04795 [Sphingobium fuliginis ATCC 27551]QHD70267.1 hypothetical protein GS397_06615 [Sphingobium yanoikuyae]QNG49118.1 hypothetical protein H3V42_18230 [Sphingobium yanoikuyae]